jgi:hypothetical protein
MNASFNRLMNQLPPSIAATFTEAQKDALSQAIQQTRGNHGINIQLSIPFPKPGFYIVIFAGQERRSVKRTKTERHNSALTATHLLMLILLLSGSIALGLIKLFPTVMTAVQNASFHPTAIPWLQSEAECVHTGRIWRDDKCWDGEHDANF